MSPSRKSTKITKREGKEDIPAVVMHLAQLNGMDPQELLGWKVYSSGKVTMVAANGMKFVHMDEHEPHA